MPCPPCPARCWRPWRPVCAKPTRRPWPRFTREANGLHVGVYRARATCAGLVNCFSGVAHAFSHYRRTRASAPGRGLAARLRVSDPSPWTQEVTVMDLDWRKLVAEFLGTLVLVV